MPKFLVALLTSLLFFPGPALASPNVYEVAASIKQDGKTIATPSVRVKPGASAEMSVAGEDGFRLSVIVMPSDSAALDVSVDVGTNQASLKSVVATLAGKPIVVSTGALEVSVTVKDGDS